MTPKEKAEELFYFFYADGDHHENTAKRYATKVADEIILEREVIFAARDIPTGTFWHEVKAEIEAL